MKNKINKWLFILALSIGLGSMMSVAEARCYWVQGNAYHRGHQVCNNNYNGNGYHNGYRNGNYRYHNCYWRNGVKYCR